MMVYKQSVKFLYVESLLLVVGSLIHLDGVIIYSFSHLSRYLFEGSNVNCRQPL